MDTKADKPMEMVDLHSQYLRLKESIDSAVQNAIHNCQYINGPEVNAFAGELAEYLSVPYVIPCANGTDALQLALMALDLQPGDEVITTPFSFVASAEVIALLKLTPVFADVDLDSYTIHPDEIRRLITPRTKVILPVHLFGQGADMKSIMEIAQSYNLYVIEDVAQALGASYSFNGETQQLGTIGLIGCTSFFPSKNLGCFGDGGACFTSDEKLASRMKMIAGHGSAKRYYHDIIGINSRLDTIQAAILRAKLTHLDSFISARREIATIYNNQLKEIDGICLPKVQDEAFHTYNQYTIRVLGGQRDKLMKHLKNEGIPSRIYYPLPLHKQKAFATYTSENSISLPKSETLSEEVLSLPIHTEMKAEEAMYVCRTIINYYAPDINSIT